MQIKSIVVDDEPRAHVILENYISRLQGIELNKKFLQAPAAIDYLQDHAIDLIFLDINMPELNGFDFLKALSSPLLVVFTTAYTEFALASYEVNAIDYLKKPISFERFSLAVKKAEAAMSHQVKSKDQATSISLVINGNHQIFELHKIRFMQSYGNYVKIFSEDGVKLIQSTTKDIEAQLPEEYFIRVHKSFIVNRSKISKIEEDYIIIGDKKIRIGKTFKAYFKKSIT